MPWLDLALAADQLADGLAQPFEPGQRPAVFVELSGQYPHQDFCLGLRIGAFMQCAQRPICELCTDAVALRIHHRNDPMPRTRSPPLDRSELRNV